MSEFRDIEPLRKEIEGLKRFIPALSLVEEMLDKLPPDGIVRCKDCRYFRTKPNHCSKLCSDDIDEDFYCKYGERKTKNRKMRYGEWLTINGKTYCSECDQEALCYKDDPNDELPFARESAKSEFCPHCGAKMIRLYKGKVIEHEDE